MTLIHMTFLFCLQNQIMGCERRHLLIIKHLTLRIWCVPPMCNYQGFVGPASQQKTLVRKSAWAVRISPVGFHHISVQVPTWSPGHSNYSYSVNWNLPSYEAVMEAAREMGLSATAVNKQQQGIVRTRGHLRSTVSWACVRSWRVSQL